MPDGGDVIGGLTDVGTNVIAPAAIGAGVGALTSAVTGGDPGTGALIGAGTGAVGGGINWAAGGPNVVAQELGIPTGQSTSIAPDVTSTGGAGGSAFGAPGIGVTTGAGPSAASFGGGAAGGVAPVDLTSAATPSGLDSTAQQAFLTDPGNVGAPTSTATPGIGAPASVPASSGGPEYGSPIGPGLDNSPTPGAGASGSTLSNITKALGLGGGSDGILGKNTLGTLVGGAGLLYNTLGNNQQLPSSSANASTLEGQAGQLAAEGQQLQSAITTGNLPPGAQAAIDQATSAAKAAIRAKYAQLGQPGSSAEIQELNNVDQQASAQAFQFADQLLSQGANLTNLSSQIYEKLISLDQAQSQRIGNAISNFAAAASGFPGVTKTNQNTGS